MKLSLGQESGIKRKYSIFEDILMEEEGDEYDVCKLI